MKRKILLMILLVAVVQCQRPQVGQFHRSDAQGNFQVNYDAGGGHYLTEDRSFDGSQLLGNYAYKSRDGESVGVAYGSDGAGFVISAPGYLSSTGTGGRGASGARSSASSSGHAASGSPASSFQHGTGSRFRYQESAAPASNQPTNWESGSSVVTSHSSLPATESATFSASAAPSFDEQQLHHQQEQQLQHQLQLQFQQQLHQQQQAFSSGQQTHINSVVPQPEPQSPLTTQFSSSQQNVQHVFVPPNIHQSAPFSYSFDTYNSLFGLQQPAQFQNQFLPAATPAPPQQQHFSYHQPSVDHSLQHNPLLEQLVEALRAQQLANAPPPSPPTPVATPVVTAPLSFPASPVAAPPTPLARISVNQIRPMANLLYLTSRPTAQILAPTLVSYAFSTPGTDAVPFQFRFPTSPALF